MATKIFGAVSAQNVDSSGETLHLDGLDTTHFREGKVLANFEHINNTPESIVGKFIQAKKIYSASDCEDEYQRSVWKQLKLPFLYGVCELFDDEGHPGAVAIAAMLRYFKKREEKVQIGFSIEGATLVRDGNDLKQTVAKRVAITLAPCNKACWADMLEDTGMDVKKFEGANPPKYVVEVDSAIIEDEPAPISLEDVKKSVVNLMKTLTAGGGNVAPSGLTGGAALVPEDPTMRNSIKAAVRDWDRKRPLREVVEKAAKAVMPEVSNSYIDHFTRLAEDLSLKKGEEQPRRLGVAHSRDPEPSPSQSQLAEGLYWHAPMQMLRKPVVLRNDHGDQVLMSPPETTEDSSDAAFNATAYHDVADLFGVADQVPTTFHIDNPYREDQTGQASLIQRHLEGAKLPIGETFRKAHERAKDTGLLHKLALLDLVMGAPRRDLGNTLIHDGHIKHVHNGHALTFQNFDPYMSGWGEEHAVADSLPVGAVTALQAIDPKVFIRRLSKNRISPEKIKKALFALKYLQKNAPKMPLLQLAEYLKRTLGVAVVPEAK